MGGSKIGITRETGDGLHGASPGGQLPLEPNIIVFLNGAENLLPSIVMTVLNESDWTTYTNSRSMVITVCKGIEPDSADLLSDVARETNSNSAVASEA